jgi:hypothetical protein
MLKNLLAWVSADKNIDIMQTSSSGLIKWESRKRTSRHSNTSASIAFNNGMLIVAWTSNDNNAFLNVTTTSDGGTM